MRSASLVERLPDGRFLVPECEPDLPFGGTAAGGVIGALVGAILGPLGLLLGGATGAVVGSIADTHKAEDTEVVLSAVIEEIPRGSLAIVADVDEELPDPLDASMRAMGDRLQRLPRAQVQADLSRR